MQLVGRFSVPNTIPKAEYDYEDTNTSLHGIYSSHIHRWSLWNELRVFARTQMEVWVCIFVGNMCGSGGPGNCCIQKNEVDLTKHCYVTIRIRKHA